MSHYAECSACHSHKMCLYVEDIHKVYPEAVQREYEERGYPSWDNICTDCLDETEADLEKWNEARESAHNKRAAGPKIRLVEKNTHGSIDAFVKEAASSGFFGYIGKVEDACKHLNLSPKVANALNAGENWVLELVLRECGRPYRQGKSPEVAAKALVDAISRALESHASPASEARRYNYGAMTKDGFVRSAAELYLKSLQRRKISPEDGYEIEDLMDTLSDSGLYLEEWVIAHIGLPKGEDEETYDAWTDERPEVNAVIDTIMGALKEKGYSVE